ncbi:MAG: UDP-galactopyranose mutase [Caulobacteraceae bacterium]
MPADGYTKMFEAIVDHPNIEVRVGVEFEDVRDEVVYDHLIFTGPIDEYFDHRYGKLPYRSLEFRHETLTSRGSSRSARSTSRPRRRLHPHQRV